MEVTFAEWVEKEVEADGKKEKVKERVDVPFESHESELVRSLALRYALKKYGNKLTKVELEKVQPKIIGFKSSKPIPGHITVGAVQNEDQFVFTLSLS